MQMLSDVLQNGEATFSLKNETIYYKLKYNNDYSTLLMHNLTLFKLHRNN